METPPVNAEQNDSKLPVMEFPSSLRMSVISQTSMVIVSL